MTATPRRIPQPTIDADLETLRALTGMADYTPHNPNYSLASAEGALERMNKAATALTLAENALAAARTQALVTRADFHDIILGVKDEAMVIYGPDSDQIAALGLTKKSDRNRRKRPAKPAADK